MLRAETRGQWPYIPASTRAMIASCEHPQFSGQKHCHFMVGVPIGDSNRQHFFSIFMSEFSSHVMLFCVRDIGNFELVWAHCRDKKEDPAEESGGSETDAAAKK